MNLRSKSKNSRKRYRDVYNFGVQKRCNCVKKHTRKHHPAVSLPLSYKQNQCEILKFWAQNWSDRCEIPWKMNAIWNQLPPGSVQTYMRKHAKTLKSSRIVESLRWIPHKKSTKNRARPGCTLQNKALNRADRTIQIHENKRIWNRFASWKRTEPCAKIAKSVKLMR